MGQQAQQFNAPPVDPYDMLEGGKRAIKFVEKDANGFDVHAPVGTSFTGTIVGDLRSAQVTDFTSKMPRFYKDGRPMMQVVMSLQTDLRDPQDPTDDGVRALYVKNQMLAAFQQALQATRHLGRIGEGTRVTVTLVNYKDVGKGNPQKLYEIKIGPEFVAYVPPEQRQTNQALYGQPQEQGGFQGAVQAGFPPAAQAQFPAQPQYANPAQPVFPGQVVPAQPQYQQPVAPQAPAQPVQQFPQAVQPQPVAPQAPQPESPALAALNAIAATPAPQAVAAPAAAANGITEETVNAFNTLRQSGIDPHTAINSLAQRLAPGNEQAFTAALAAAVGVELAPQA
jgi:hypothetical protein